jgi:hypothetical protein
MSADNLNSSYVFFDANMAVGGVFHTAHIR